MNQKTFVRNPLINLALGIVYAIVYDYVYVHYMAVYFSYLGCPESNMSNNMYLGYIILTSFPMLFYKGYKYISSGFSVFIYLLIYVPMLYITIISPTINIHERVFIIVTLVLTQVLFHTYDGLMVFKKGFQKPTKKLLSFSNYEKITLVIIAFILITEGNSLTYVDMFAQSDMLYELRESYGDNRLLINGYLICWCKGALLPILLVCYLKQKNWIKYSMTFSGFILMFMLDMQKNTMLMPFLMTALFFVARRTFFTKYYQILMVLVVSITSLLLVMYSGNLFIYPIAALFVMRTQCLDSWIFSMYLDFFQNQPYTYWTHINIVNLLTGAYPYNEPLGVMVSDGEMNANASFLITDGYAAIGPIGILLIGIVFIILRGIINSSQLRYAKNDLLILMLPALLGALNSSVFTAILTSGFLIVYLSLRFVDLTPLKVNN